MVYRRRVDANPIVRVATPEDLEPITEVHVEGWQWGYRGQLPDEALDGIDAGERRALWRRALAGEFPDADVWVADRAGRVVGFVSAGPSRDPGAAADEGEIYSLYVRRDAAGTPAGHRLLQTALAALDQRGAASAVVWVLASNARARRFYERAGFRPDGGEKSAPWQGLELHEVRYRLRGPR
jgi:ribosomal protein S18 acetylase RimI-like enzyme